MTTTATIQSTEIIELTPSYKLPLVLVISAPVLALVQVWLSLPIALLGLFLMFQTSRIRLVFTPRAMEVYVNATLIRSFPYSDWQNWRIFWNPVPILFYFKEVKSIHFLPILFDPKMLRNCLEQRYPLKSSADEL
ncbi:MAG: DUF3119 family protein [Hormoscilla sp. GM102CHS1]|nr:DUF3119 family protein [Hormoscilla sp. GM102CHS1]